MEDAFARSVSEVLEAFGVDPAKGLTDAQVAENAKVFGRNVLPQEGSTPFWKLILKQFDDLLVKILIVAAIISFLLALFDGDTGLTAFLEPSVILMILAANAAVGVITETNAEKAIEELRAYQADVATVLRNGATRSDSTSPGMLGCTGAARPIVGSPLYAVTVAFRYYQQQNSSLVISWKLELGTRFQPTCG